MPAMLTIDVNGSDGPNQNAIDKFHIPLKYSGIDYECRECNVDKCIGCDLTDSNKCIICQDYKYTAQGIYKCNCILNNDGSCDCTGDKCVLLE